MKVLARQLPIAALLALPGALTAYTGFQAGGFFAGTQGFLVVVLAIALVLWVTLAGNPLAGASPALAIAAGALALFAVWVLVSASWSDSPARALLEFDRALLYLLVLVLFGLLPMTPDRLRWIVRGVALAMLALCIAAFVSRTLPDLLPTGEEFNETRLAYPITYSNALGLLAALGAIFALHMTSSEQEPRAVRILAAAAVPVFAVTAYLTFSRGGIAAGAIGVLFYLVLGVPRLILTGLVTVVPATVVALTAAYRAGALAASDVTTATAVAQGQRVAHTVALCAVGAAIARALLLLVDDLVVRRSRWLPRPVVVAAVTLALAGAGLAFVSVGGPGYMQRQYELFVQRPSVTETGDARDRLLAASSNGRIDFWKRGVRSFESERFHGHGAGSYQLLWNRDRPYFFQLVDGHSLYVESLAELGAVGFGLLVVALLALLWGIVRRIRGPDRALFVCVLAATATWALRAGLDWDWEMPVLTLWVFAIGGATLATPVGPGQRGRPATARTQGRLLRVVVAVGLLVLAVTPARVALSQRHLNESVSAFARGDCPSTVNQALASIDAIAVRPEPYELLGYCDVRLGAPALGVRAMNSAVTRDPGNWQYRYGLALVRAAAGLDPRPAARRALQLNPREPLAQEAVRAFDTSNRRLWRARALSSELPST